MKIATKNMQDRRKRKCQVLKYILLFKFDVIIAKAFNFKTKNKNDFSFSKQACKPEPLQYDAAPQHWHTTIHIQFCLQKC
jgi:hypothetical protein